MRRITLGFTAAMLATSSVASATGTPTPTPDTTPSSSVSTATSTGGDSKSLSGALAGAGAVSGSTSGSNSATTGSGNSQIRVDAGTNSRYRAIFIPPVVPMTPPSSVAVGDIVKETMACGPLQRVVRTPVDGIYNGLLSRSKIPQGWTEDLAPYLDENGNRQTYREEKLSDGSTRLYGSQPILFVSVLGVASARNIALGGGSGGGSWGQGGLGGSSSNQRMVTNIQLRDCEVGTVVYEKEIVEVEVQRKKTRR